jgi:AraC family transcriptional regulator
MPTQAIALSAAASDKLQLSSRGLGWGPLNLEHRDTAPARRVFAEGARTHLVAVGLSSGRVRCERGGHTSVVQVQPGTVTVQPAGLPVTWHFDTPLSYAVLSLSPALMREVALSFPDLARDGFELLPAERESDASIANVAGVLANEVVSAQAGSELYAQSLARILAVHLLRHYTAVVPAARILAPIENSARVPPPVARAMEHMRQHFAEDLSLDALSQAAHCSTFHLSRRFRQATGMTLSQYLIRLRVEHARHLLRTGAGGRSLSEVAHAAGFSDQSHLTRHMKRLLGVTPGTLRAA